MAVVALGVWGGLLTLYGGVLALRLGMKRHGSATRWRRGIGGIAAVASIVVGGVLVAFAILRPSGAEGITGQGTSFELGITHGRVEWLRTSLTASCVGGSRWKASWAPPEGTPVHFSMAGRSLSTHELTEPRYSDGTVGRIAFVMHGRLTGRSSAEGTVRLVARFYDGEDETGACDSLDVPWAVGPGASKRLHQVPLGRVVNAYYPEVPSLAGRVSAARQRFIDVVDDTCVRTYDEGIGHEQDVERTLPRGIDSRLNAYYVAWHLRQLQALIKLGSPPDGATMYDAWLSNFRGRVDLERQALQTYRHGDLIGSQRLLDSVDRLGITSHQLGQRFGLVLCTSNGDRTPVQVLSDDPSRPLP